jgi:hypothetical protein
MSAVGNVGPATGATVVDDALPGLWGSFGAALRLIVGWFSVAIAILNLIAELDRLPGPTYLLFHAVLLVGGLLLISISWGAAGTGPAGYSAFGAVLAGGTFATALPVNDTVCCMTVFAVRHGYPFTFLARNGGGRWHFDLLHLLADLLFWGYAGLLVLVLVATARRVTRPRRGPEATRP